MTVASLRRASVVVPAPVHPPLIQGCKRGFCTSLRSSRGGRQRPSPPKAGKTNPLNPGSNAATDSTLK